MAIIVDKIQKRKDIALSCKGMLLEKGINNITISLLTKEAGISKGSFYDYFQNKEDIVFEIVNLLFQEHNIRKIETINSEKTTRDKIKAFFKTFYNDEDKELREIFKYFKAVSLTNPSQEMTKYQTEKYYEYLDWFKSIFQEGIDNGEISPNSMKLTDGLFTYGNGIYIVDITVDKKTDIKDDINSYIDAIFDLIEIKG